MNVFLPFKKAEYHPYLDEIKNYSQCDFIYDDLKNYNPSCGIVNIHWPEAIFNWNEPTLEELSELENEIVKWKMNSKICYTKHDLVRHKGMTPNFTKLFDIIEKNTDVFIHLGAYSKKLYQDKYPNANHEIIYHPIFETSYTNFSKLEARKILGIDKDAVVIIVPGKIRSFKERNIVLKSFKGLKVKNKTLIATNMRTELQMDFPGRVRFKKYFDVQKHVVEAFKAKHKSPKYIFNYNSISSEDMSLKMSAADIVLVPRIDLLNSGNVFLGLTFKKVVVGAATGNIKEQLKSFDFPIYDPKSIKSVIKALEKGIKLNKTEANFNVDLNKYLPINVAMEYDRIFLKYTQ